MTSDSRPLSVSYRGSRTLQLRLGVRRSLWERDSKAASVSVLGFKRELSGVCFNGPFCNSQTESGTTVLSRSCFIDAVKTIEDSRLQFSWNSGACVADIDNRSISRLCDRYFDLAAERGVLYSVVD